MNIRILFILILTTIMNAQTSFTNINDEINQGNYSTAINLIEQLVSSDNLPDSEKEKLSFEVERLSRIKKDFTKTEADVINYVKEFIPDVDSEMLKEWENDGSLEFKVIDGEKYYFNRSHTNLFRINKKLKAVKASITGDSKDDLDAFLEKKIPNTLSEIKDNGGNYGNPERIKLTYQLTVPANKLPAGEIIKCWLPYPRDGYERQKLISFNSPDNHTIADNSYLQRSVYFEKPALTDEPTQFSYELILENKAIDFNVDSSLVKEYVKNSDYQKFTSERSPHIVFTEKIKNLSAEIIGAETNPYLKAKKIFKWINDNIPWAGAREYSTILNISDYCLTNMHGDCGIKTLLFMTLARYNGIPTKWQSGWMLHPGHKNLHDWCEAYFEGYGWVPVDQSFALVESDDERVKYFYLGGIDQYRFIVNDDYSSEFYPAKEHFRSETVDFQRGEVEWSGGNLYFDDWDYSMKVEYLD